MEMTSSTRPPAILNDGTPIPSAFNTSCPAAMKTISVAAATMTVRSAIARRSRAVSPWVTEMNSGASPIGLTITKNATASVTIRSNTANRRA